MAQPLAINTTLAIAADLVREKAGVLDQQESEVFNLQLVDYIHQAILVVSQKVPKSKYTTEITVTETANFIDVSTLDFASVEKDDLALIDSLSGTMSFVEHQEFNQILNLYSTADLANALIGHISNVGGKWQIETIRGTNKPKGTLTFHYVRNPIYTQTFSTLIDLPEEFVPQMIDIAAQIVLHTPQENK